MITTNIATIYEITEVTSHGGFYEERAGRFGHKWELQDFLGAAPYRINNMDRALKEFATAYLLATKDANGVAEEFEFSHGWATYTVRPATGKD